jgi:hypothetical protein
MITSSIEEGCIPALFTASLMTIAPSFVAGTVESVPWNLPIGVRQALTMTASLPIFHPLPLILPKKSLFG